MAKKKFRARFTVEVDLEVDEEILAVALSSEWAKNFYSLGDDHGVAGHLAFNLVQGKTLDQVDGFADRQPDEAKLLKAAWGFDSAETL